MSAKVRLAMFLAIAAAPGLAQEARMNLDVVPVDSHGQFVPDLQSGDIQVLDNGKPQKIVSFRLVNAAEQPSGSAPSTVVVFDLYNANRTEWQSGKEELVRAFEHSAPNASVYLYILTPAGGLYTVHGIPEGAGTRPADPQWPSGVGAMLDAAMTQINRLKPLTDLLPIYRAPSTWGALNGVASAMANLPGRKNLVWITQGVPTGYIYPPNEFINNPRPLRAFAARLSQMDAVAYTVQQRIDENLPHQGEGSEWDTLRQLTNITGGRAFPTDATEEAIGQAIRDASRYYQVEYERPADSTSGKYRAIRIKSSRKDLHFQTKQGYYTQPNLRTSD